MNSQRETDIMLLEAKEYVRKIFEEWLHDYLGSRAQKEAPPVGGAGGAATPGAATTSPAPAQYNTGY